MQNDYPEPPTIYSLLNSYVNYGKPTEEQKSIKDLAKYGRSMFFYTDYPLSENISKEDFEVMILNHFLMRRIGFDTVNAFSIRLINKLCEIMPNYNKMFDALNGWDIFTAGETITRASSTNESNINSELENASSTASNSISNTASDDNRFSDTPQNQINDVQNGNYVTQYTNNTSTNNGSSSETNQSNSSKSGSNSGTSNTNETINRTPSDKITIYNEFIKNRNHIYSMIFEELESLFYQNVLI